MSATFPSGIPNFFLSPMAAFPSRNLFHSSGRQAEGGAAFTPEDRLMLQLLYQQQQAIQLQLQSMALLVQQLQLTLAGMCGQPAAASEVAFASSAPASAPMTTQSPLNNTVDAAAPSREAQKKDPPDFNVNTESCVVRNPGAKEISCSCTPPSEDLDVSRRSATNRSMESVPPWDPSAGSRQSSVIRSARGENPLLSSLRGKLPTPNRSSVASVSTGTGHTVSANVSAAIEEKRPFIRPATRPVSSSSARVDPDVGGASSSAAQGAQWARQQQQQQQQQQRIALENQKAGPSQRAGTGVGRTPRAAIKAKKGSPLVKEWGAVCSHQNEGEGQENGDANVSATGYDSQSDGYGSYETRQYLKSVGII